MKVTAGGEKTISDICKYLPELG